jgi:5,10-methylenetetrahydrofolate reductase
MIAEARRFSADHEAPNNGCTIGVTTTLGQLPSWKLDADRLFAQVSFSIDRLVEWRSTIDFAGPVYAGVMVVASAAMGRKLTSEFDQLAVPAAVIDHLEHDRDSGVELACDLVLQVRESGVFDGVHLVPVGRYRDVARRLEPLLA